MKKTILLLLAVTALLSSCFYGELISGSGNIISEEIIVGAEYSAIEFNAIGDVVLANSPLNYVTLTGDDNIVAEIDVYVSGDTLYLETDPFKSFSSFTLTIYVPARNIDTIASGGVGDISADHTISASSFSLTNSGAGDIELTVSADSLECVLSGVGDIILDGSAGYLYAALSGVGDIEAENLPADSCYVYLSGVGDIEITVQDSINGALSGVGDIYCWGSPSVMGINVTGVGHVYRM